MNAGRCWILLAVALTVQANAADPAQCTTIEDPSKRLVCYDAAHGRSGQPAPTPAMTPVAAPAAAAGETGASAFGMEDRTRREPQPQASEEASQESITATVSDVQRHPQGNFILKLDNAQRWRVLESSNTLSFESGERVSIRRGLFGSFLLTREKGGAALRARRVE